MDPPSAITMHNFHMVGVHNMDRFSLRGCFLVIGAFGVITLISYFNELAKAGLLSGHQKFRAADAFTLKRPLDVAGDHGDEDVVEQVLLKKDGGLHQLDLNLLPFQREQKPSTGNTSKDDSDGNEEIQIALRLGKDDEYQRANKSSTNIYQYHNVLPNFYITLNSSFPRLQSASNPTSELRKALNNFTRNTLQKKVRHYRNRTRVVIYQHDPEGYALRDCLLALSMETEKVLPPAPLNALYRKSWESMDRGQKSKFDILYGGLSFGVCESMSKECSYAAMISHPLDRLLQVYASCKKNSSITMCRFLEMSNVTTIRSFLEYHGSSFFQKLLYYSRHCRLVGQDEVCIHDSNVYFVLSYEEKQEYLKDILQNIEKWFSVVGLVEQLPASLTFLHTVLGLKFGDCISRRLKPPKHFFDIFRSFHRFEQLSDNSLQTLDVDGVPYFEIRDKLLQDKEVGVWLSADMAIYEKFVEIFNKQLSVQKTLKKLMQNYYKLKRQKLKFSRDKERKIMQRNITVEHAADRHLNLKQNKLQKLEKAKLKFTENHHKTEHLHSRHLSERTPQKLEPTRNKRGQIIREKRQHISKKFL